MDVSRACPATTTAGTRIAARIVARDAEGNAKCYSNAATASTRRDSRRRVPGRRAHRGGRRRASTRPGQSRRKLRRPTHPENRGHVRGRGASRGDGDCGIAEERVAAISTALPPPPASFARGAALFGGVAGVASVATLHAKDANGNAVSSGLADGDCGVTLTPEFTFVGTVNASATCVVANATRGEFGVEVTAYTAGAYALEVTLRGAVVGAFAGVTFAADRTDAANSTVTGAGLATAVARRDGDARRRTAPRARSARARRRRRRRLRAVTRVRGQRNPGRVGHRGGRRRRDVCGVVRRAGDWCVSTRRFSRIGSRVRVALRRRRDARGHRGGVVVRRGGCDRGRRGRKQHVRDSRRQRTRRRAGGRRRRGRRVGRRLQIDTLALFRKGATRDAFSLPTPRTEAGISSRGARIACVTIRTAFPSRTCSTSRSAARTFAGVLFSRV